MGMVAMATNMAPGLETTVRHSCAIISLDRKGGTYFYRAGNGLGCGSEGSGYGTLGRAKAWPEQPDKTKIFLAIFNHAETCHRRE